MFRLSTAAADKYNNASCEGLLDHIQYMITSDKSISEKIGNMLYQMQKMDEDDKKKVESISIPFKMAKLDDVKKLMDFSKQAVEFVMEKCRKYESKSYSSIAEERQEMQQEVEAAAAQFEGSHDIKEIHYILSNEEAEKDKTYAVQGYTFDNLYLVAKAFKDAQTGYLTRMRKMKFITTILAHGFTNDGHVKVANTASWKFTKLLNRAMDCYTYVNKFLFFTYKELLRNKLIHE